MDDSDDVLVTTILAVAPDAHVRADVECHRLVTGEFANGYGFSIVPWNWLRAGSPERARAIWASGVWELLILNREGGQVEPNPVTGSQTDALVSGSDADELREVLRKLAALPRI